MTEKQAELIAKLKELFQFGDSDLDFGIYKIINHKRAEIESYLSVELPHQINEQLKTLVGTSRQESIAEIDKKIAAQKSMGMPEDTKPIIEKLERQRKALSATLNIDDMEADIYSRLASFFARYYDEGDFISQRRYKDGAYAIPYEGEEVKLHWANADQYYIKTAEYFKDYTFKTATGKTVTFKLVDAKTEKDNNKGKNKRFKLHKEHPFAVESDALTIRFEYKEDENKQEYHIDETVNEFKAVAIGKGFDEFANIVQPAADVDNGKSCLEINLKRYTAKNTFDYFIHKDLNKFLSRELDFYIKNDVVYLDDIDTQNADKTAEYLHKAKVIRGIGRKIITLLSQIEDFQKKLFLKKKFVYETNYCVTLDRVPRSLYGEIAGNEGQVGEWVKLFAIDEIKAEDGDLMGGGRVGFSMPLSVRFLEENQGLVVDTGFFGWEFKEKLVDSMGEGGVDEGCEGVLIHSENFQGLNLLQGRYRGQIGGIYIDPPYNTNASEILYKNGYKDSSWISLIYDRIKIARKLMKDSAFNAITIDYLEMFNLGEIADSIYNRENRVGVVTIFINPKGRQHERYFASSTEHMYVYANKLGAGEFNKTTISQEKSDTFEYEDAKGKYRLDPFARVRSSTLHTLKPDAYYPIYVSDDLSVTTIEPRDGYIPIYPKSNGVEYSWKVNYNSFEEDYNKHGDIVAMRDGKEIIIYNKYYEQQVFHNFWIDKKYYPEFNGTNLLKDIFGNDYYQRLFKDSPLYPKSIFAVEDSFKIILPNDNIALDYFAGSGTAGHAIINLNRADSGTRKYILIEMGEYFDTVTKPRIQKVIYSMDTETEKGWKDGKPVSRKGSSHCFKYLRLESYEDALNNITVSPSPLSALAPALPISAPMREEYLLNYSLDFETRGSSTLLNVSKFDKPFDYALNITRKSESRPVNVDLVETFNYLIGLIVRRSYKIASYGAEFTTGEYGAVVAELIEGDGTSGAYKFKMVEGKNLGGDEIVVIWRELTGDTIKDNAVLDAFWLKRRQSVIGFERATIYVNGDNNLLNLRGDGESLRVLLIEEEMKKLMFEGA